MLRRILLRVEMASCRQQWLPKMGTSQSVFRTIQRQRGKGNARKKKVSFASVKDNFILSYSSEVIKVVPVSPRELGLISQ